MTAFPISYENLTTAFAHGSLGVDFFSDGIVIEPTLKELLSVVDMNYDLNSRKLRSPCADDELKEKNDGKKDLLKVPLDSQSEAPIVSASRTRALRSGNKIDGPVKKSGKETRGKQKNKK
ncbi:hypothetical protein QAD02_002143 [Eretmocerus hayati]|uniref:Uncharacterized protein n=1 Tax=Eretmocerus hayati TaxID=131215 RepID=A0ACC2NI16_9HYME|nr:hypothetical protein QAD02_002143 [Eretmocerus hayati]